MKYFLIAERGGEVKGKREKEKGKSALEVGSPKSEVRSRRSYR